MLICILTPVSYSNWSDRLTESESESWPEFRQVLIGDQFLLLFEFRQVLVGDQFLLLFESRQVLVADQFLLLFEFRQVLVADQFLLLFESRQRNSWGQFLFFTLILAKRHVRSIIYFFNFQI